MTKTLAIITAGGIGRRFSDETLKQLAPYDQNLSVLDKTLEAKVLPLKVMIGNPTRNASRPVV